MKTLPHYTQKLCLELYLAIRCLESNVLDRSRSQCPGRTRKLRNMQDLSNVAHAPPEAHRKFLIYCNEGQYFWSVRQLSLWRPTANSSLPSSENVCLLKPKMKWQEAPAQQTGDESIPLAGVYPRGKDPAPNDPEGEIWETSPTGQAVWTAFLPQGQLPGWQVFGCTSTVIFAVQTRSKHWESLALPQHRKEKELSLKTAGLEKAFPEATQLNEKPQLPIQKGKASLPHPFV